MTDNETAWQMILGRFGPVAGRMSVEGNDRSAF